MTGMDPSSLSTQQRHFYLAVDRVEYRMETLTELLGMAGRRHFLPMALCCSTRDDLDAVCSSLSSLSHLSLHSLYSDLAETERGFILDKFRRWNVITKSSPIIVVTDACLPSLASGEPLLNARLLLNYDLPPKKETYMRRMASCLAADGIVVNMVVGGEVVTLKSIEESCGLVIAEMPINIFEMF